MLSLTAIEKSYGATRAVKSVTLAAAPGTVLGLAGENGAGKSTIIKILSGAVAADSGAIALDGQVIAPRDTNEALSLGIASVFQELTLVGDLSVERNLYLTDAPRTPWRTIDGRKMRAAAREVLRRYDLAVDPAARVSDLPLGQRQQLEIVRAAERKPRVLVLDEATSALGANEVAWLARLVARLSAENAIIIFISHRWDEVTHFCSRVAILRNGELVSVADTSELSEDDAISLMTGQGAHGVSFPEKSISSGGTVLAARNLVSASLRGVSIELRQGEVLGLGGLVGQGQGSLLEALFGAHALGSGAVEVNGASLSRLTPRRAMSAGIAYVPQERKTEGLLLDKSVGVNMTLATLGALRSAFGLIDRGAEAVGVCAAITRRQIKTQGPNDPIRNLSGGNQQKVLLEKWLLTRPSILLLNDVTRGVDVVTKRQIYVLIADIARQGVGVVWYSTDARELVGVVHRVVVMLQGRINATLTGDAITPDRIIRASVVASSPMENADGARLH